MDQERQNAFQKLRPACVELSSVALRFRGHQAAIKEVLNALTEQYRVLKDLGSKHQLDEKLAEYAFFPLTHVFNESQKLSQRCMQLAVQSVTVLVAQGWRLKLAPTMGKQILILMVLLAGGDPRRQAAPPSDELKCASFDCVGAVLSCLSRSPAGRLMFGDESTRKVADQIAYLLVENLSEATSDDLQVAAADALQELIASISDRVFLASLLPRTVSALTRALKPATQARRTRKVLMTNIRLLQATLKAVLADNVAFRADQTIPEKDALSHSWLKATVAQIKTALTQVCKLRNHEQEDVRQVLFRFCMVIMEDCSKTLVDSLPVLVETAAVLTGTIDSDTVKSEMSFLLSVRPELSEMLRSGFYDWCQTLPRIMSGTDDKPKEVLLSKLMNTFKLLSSNFPASDTITNVLGTAILKSITSTIEASNDKTIQIYHIEPQSYLSLLKQDSNRSPVFGPVLFHHQSQKQSATVLQNLIENLHPFPEIAKIARTMIDNVALSSANDQIAFVWLALKFLDQDAGPLSNFDDFVNLGDISGQRNLSRPFLIQDLYSQLRDILTDSSPYGDGASQDPRIVALTLETVVLQAQQLGTAYRTELYETLYPILALLSSKNSIVQNHAIVTLNALAICCKYESVSALLIENVDYLVNSIAWKLNTFNLTPEAPAVLHMVIRLVGAKVIPYLDDLIASIFAALDSFHGYTQWVEMLFEVLRAMVDESVKTPLQLIDRQQDSTPCLNSGFPTSTIDDILGDIRVHKRRRLDRTTSDIQQSAPHRPWTKAQDDPNYKPDPTEGKDIETLLREAEKADESNDLPAPKETQDEDSSKPLSKSHAMLLKIAQATVPHLSSPSAKVRHTLLQLLAQLSLLLAQHENTFLPLVNVIWTSTAQRLFAEITTPALGPDDQQSFNGELAYNIAAAADLVAILCESAGDFMASRIEQIFSQLKSMHSKLWKEVEAQLARNQKASAVAANTASSAIEDTSGENIRGVVDLQVMKDVSSASELISKKSSEKYSAAMVAVSRTGSGQIFNSLVHLLVAILNHVRLSEDNADEIFDMLAPLIDRPSAVGQMVQDALEKYNSDAVWVMQCRKAGEDEIARGARSMYDRVWVCHNTPTPVLGDALRRAGLDLRAMVF